jgi:hypothetical protein
LTEQIQHERRHRGLKTGHFAARGIPLKMAMVQSILLSDRFVGHRLSIGVYLVLLSLFQILVESWRWRKRGDEILA